MRKLASLLTALPRKLPKQVRASLQPIAPAYRFLRQTYYEQLDERIVETPSGVKPLIHPSNYVERNLAAGTFEPGFVSHFESLSSEISGTFADIGANIGFYSLLLRQFNSAAHIDAFEPLPRNVARFQNNIEINDAADIGIHRIALGAEPGTTKLSVSDQNPAEASIGVKQYSRESRSATVEVSMETMDTFYQDRTFPSLVKIDVEGAEGVVIAGGSEVLSSTPELLLELHPTLLSNFGYTVDEIVEQLLDAGYTQVYWVEQNTRMPLDSVKTRPFSDTTHLHIS